MSNKRADYEREYKAIVERAAKIDGDISRLKSQIAGLQDQVNSELFEGKTSDSLSKLIEMKYRLDALENLRGYAASQVEAGKRALAAFDAAELAERVGVLERQALQIEAEIQAEIGAEGLNGKLAKLDQLRKEMLAMGWLGAGGTEAVHRSNGYINLIEALRPGLQAAWMLIESHQWIEKAKGRKFGEY
jgi:hypothetical protein